MSFFMKERMKYTDEVKKIDFNDLKYYYKDKYAPEYFLRFKSPGIF